MKASGSYASLVHGVSEQVPQQRRPGQVTEQVNMLPDPVTGLTRRHGSRFQAESALDIDPDSIAAMVADTANWRTFEYSNNGNDIVVLVRHAAKPASSELPFLLVYNRTTKAFLDYQRPETDTFLDAVEAGGVSAITSVGKFVFMAGNTTVATSTSTDLWGTTDNQRNSVVWIRGGAYSRKFTVSVTKMDGTNVSFEYETPTSSYPGTLDTTGVPIWALDPAGGTQSDVESLYVDENNRSTLAYGEWNATGMLIELNQIVGGLSVWNSVSNSYPITPGVNQYSWDGHSNLVQFWAGGHTQRYRATYTHDKVITNPNYTTIVENITNAFNSAVTNWIGTAAAAIQPANIAEQLRLAAVAAGLTTATRTSSTLIFDNVKAITVTDGGDGSLIRGVAAEITSIDDVSDIHMVGKIVKVRARDSANAFYLKAVPRDPNVTSGYTQVTWVEGAGVQHAITSGLLYGTVVGSTFYVASSAALLNGLVTLTPPAPDYLPSKCGDANSSPLPFFIGRKITYLGIFQDRLLIGAGAVLRCSKTGDYLNLFRTSVLTVPADDPLEMLSQGSEDDELRYSVLYDRDLVLFGKLRQYAVSGRTVLSPTNANMQVMSSHANAADVPPLAVGGLIFYGKLGETNSSVHQIQPGQVAESPESFLVSSQIAEYLRGSVTELKNHAKPTHLFVRTAGARNSIFCFTYLDDPQGRVQDAWHRFDFDAGLGPVVGMSPTPDGLLMFRLQSGLKADASGNETWIVADLCPMTTGLSIYPYLDSLRPWADVEGSTGSVFPTRQGNWKIAFDGSSPYRFVGGALGTADDLLADFPSATGPMVGMLQPAYVTPTNPFIKDRNSNAVTTGRLVITSLRATFADTSGYVSELTANQQTISHRYNGRVLGDINNIVGTEPVTDTLQSFPIGRETREYTLTLRARDWMPFTLTALEWVGQFFNRPQRF